MKTSLEQFNELVFTFEVEETNGEFNEHENPIGVDDNDEVIYKPYFESWRAGYVTATCDDIKIVFSYVANGGTESYQDAYDFTIEIDENTDIESENITLVDDDGDELDDYRFEIVEKFAGGEWESLVELPEPEIEEIDIDEDNMETITVKRDNDKDIRFSGEEIAMTSSYPDQAAGSNWSRETGRWTVLRLYKTAGGKFICSQIGKTQWQGEHDRYKAAICDNEAQIIEFFGTGWLAKDLYAEAGIECVEIVD